MPEETGFIKKINEIYQKLNVIVKASEIYDEQVVETLNRLEDQDLTVIIEDLKKSNYLGNRKIDIDLALNNLSTTVLPAYQKANVILVDGTKLEMPFDNGSGGILELNSHADIKNYIVNHQLYIDNVVDTEIVVNEAFGEQTAFIRVRDADGKASNIERIELFVFSGSVVEQKVSYFWAKTTSALETLANRVGDIIQLGNDIDSIVTLSQRIDELISLQGEIGKLIDLHTNLNSLLINANNIADIKVNSSNAIAIANIGENILKLNSIYENIEEILASKEYVQIATDKAILATEKAQTATDKATLATSQAQVATEQAQIAKQKVDTIQAITVQGQTLAAGQNVSVSYNPVTNKFTFGIPQGLKGDRGEAFKVNSIGTIAQRALYDDQLTNFSFLASDVVVDSSTIPHIYFKKSDAVGDWTTGIPFGRGEKGDTGDTGVGISSITRTSGTGASGSTDTYTITLTDLTTHEFTVYNGADSDIDSSDLNALSLALSQSIEANTNSINAHKNDKANPHEVTKEQLGLGNVNNTSDKDKPLSDAAIAALANKADKSDIKNLEGDIAGDINFTGNISFSGSIIDKTDIYSLGVPGEIGFGVATALPSWYTSIGAVPLEGHDIKTSPNYGNYMHMASGAIIVCTPKHYYKITNNIFD